MQPTDLVRLHGVPHPAAPVRHAGFPLDHPYLEQCRAPIIGPTSVLLLRRLPTLWRQDLSIEVDLAELAHSLGLGRSTSPRGPMRRTLSRIATFGFATPSGDTDLDVYTEAPPLNQRQLDRVPASTSDRHHHLLGRHLDHLARLHTTPTPTITARTDLTTRLDLLTKPRPPTPTTPGLTR